jgi:4-amino-4-deoxy-L-arabinose transferase-like glycosyltransferase
MVDVDTPIFMLALIGLPRLMIRKRFYFYWLFIALMFLLAWNTKWPQYALVVLPPMSVSASEGLNTVWSLGRNLLVSLKGRHEREQVPPGSP